MADRWRNPNTRSGPGFPVDEVVSSLQKEIRRGNPYAATFRALDLAESGAINWAWKRLLVIASEDVGPAAPHIPAAIWALHQTNVLMTNKKSPTGKEMKEAGTLYLVNAVCLLALAPKSRMAADIGVVARKRWELGERLEIPDYAKDMHTAAGRAMGRRRESRTGLRHWQAESRTMKDETDIGAEWKDELDRLWSAERFPDDANDSDDDQ